MSVLMKMAVFPGKSAGALAVVHRLPVDESPQVLTPAACSLGEPASKVALSATPLSSNRLRHFLKVTLCSTWGQLSKVGAGVQTASAHAGSGARTLQRTGTDSEVYPAPIPQGRCFISFKTMGKDRNFNLTMCYPGEHTTDLSW